MNGSFMTWSIAQMWDWIIHLPALGFMLVLMLFIIVVARVVGFVK